MKILSLKIKAIFCAGIYYLSYSCGSGGNILCFKAVCEVNMILIVPKLCYTIQLTSLVGVATCPV